MIDLNYQKDLQGFKTDALFFSDLIYTATLADTTNDSITIPSTTKNWIVRITQQYNGICWCAVNATAGVPAGGTFGLKASMLLPAYKPLELKVVSGDTVSIYNATGANCNVSIELFRVVV